MKDIRKILRDGVLIAVLLAPVATNALADEGGHLYVSNYAGEESRHVKSLSSEDIAELKRGSGWGLAKAAELNGVPGPVHLLEMQEEISLTDSQITAIKSLYEQMMSQAIDQGLKLIALERELESHFQNRTITDSILRSSLDAIADTRRDLRYIHLAAHLKTPDILSEEQIKRYNLLRGYSNPNPCANVPKGHNADLWRKHNGCE